METDRPAYPIGTVSSMTQLTPRQIRYYELQGLLKPSRTAGRHRLYSRAEVERLRALKDLLAEGLTLAGARAVLDGERRTSAVQPPPVSPLDHTALAGRLQQGRLPNSLFPVKDQPLLIRLLEKVTREEDEPRD